MHRSLLALALLCACIPAEVRTLRKEPLTHNVVFVRGGGGNSLVLADGRSAFVFDPKMWPWDAELRRMLVPGAIDSVYVANSHAHEDHTQGNRLFPSALIFAAPAALEELAVGTGSQLPREGGVPNVAVRKRLRIHVGGEPIVLVHPGPAHTAGDLYAWLPRRKLLVTGDLFDHGYYPHIDRKRGGTLLGYIAALDELSQYPAEIVLPGHGGQARREDLQAMLRFLRDLQRGVQEGRAAGQHDDEILDAHSKPNGERLENLGMFSSRRDVVRELLEELPPR